MVYVALMKIMLIVLLCLSAFGLFSVALLSDQEFRLLMKGVFLLMAVGSTISGILLILKNRFAPIIYYVAFGVFMIFSVIEFGFSAIPNSSMVIVIALGFYVTSAQPKKKAAAIE